MTADDDVRDDWVRRWIQKAEDDGRLSHSPEENRGPFAEATAFHAEQVVEKYLEAFRARYRGLKRFRGDEPEV